MKPQDPTTAEELQRMLSAGMGRAILFLMRQDLSQYRDLILDSCLHNHAYDPQCEDNRAEYLYPLIKLSGEANYYRRTILQALIDTTGLWDAEQLLEFAMLFTRDGNAEAREAIYEKLQRNDLDDPLYADEVVIELDGMEGLVFLLDLIGRNTDLLARNKDDSAIRTAEKKVGVEEVRHALRKAALESPNVAAALDNMPNYSPDWTAEEIIERRDEVRQDLVWLHRDRAAGMGWDDLKRSPAFRELVVAWARQASEEEFRKAASDLSTGMDTERLRHHLRMFWKRPFPLAPDPLICLVDHPDEGVVIQALNALELVKHPDVRTLFERLSKHPKWSERAIGLLRNNYQPGDCKLIMEMLDAETGLDRLHGMSHGTMDVYRNNSLSEGVEPLLMVYEKDPCSTCRHICIETIEMLSRLPEWMVEECLYDAYSCTRELAQEIKQGTRNPPAPKQFPRA